MSCPVSAPVLLEGWCEQVPDLVVRGLCLDHRQVQPGHAFVAVNGGMQHVHEARARGAGLVIHDILAEAPSPDIPSAAVPGLERCIPALAARYYRYPAEQLRLAGVTGTNGRDTVAHYLAQSWQRVEGAAGLIGSAGCGPFTGSGMDAFPCADPVSLQRALFECIDHGAEMAALEVSARALERGDMDHLAFDVAVFTDLDENHPEYDGTAMRRLFTDCLPRFAVVNHDDPEGKTLSRLADRGTQVLTYGTNGATELNGSVLGMDSTGMRLGISGPWGGGEIRTGLLGSDNLPWLLAAAGTLALMGMPWNRVMHQLEIMRAVPGRMSTIGGESGQPVAVIDGARNPAALEKVLLSLRSHLHGRLTCVIGNGSCAGQQEMARTAEAMSDQVVITSDGPGGECPPAVFDDALGRLECPAEALVIPDRAGAIQQALRDSGPADIVLIAGMGQGGSHTALADEVTVRELLEDAA